MREARFGKRQMDFGFYGINRSGQRELALEHDRLSSSLVVLY